MYVCIYVHFSLYTSCIASNYTSQPTCFEMDLYTDDLQLLHRIYLYMITVPSRQRTRHIIFFIEL